MKFDSDDTKSRPAKIIDPSMNVLLLLITEQPQLSQMCSDIPMKSLHQKQETQAKWFLQSYCDAFRCLVKELLISNKLMLLALTSTLSSARTASILNTP